MNLVTKSFREQVLAADFRDRRINQRLLTLFSNLGTSGSISEMLSNPYQLKAYYRFLNNQKVNDTIMDEIFASSGLKDCRGEQVVLGIQTLVGTLLSNWEWQGIWKGQAWLRSRHGGHNGLRNCQNMVVAKGEVPLFKIGVVFHHAACPLAREN